jgi:hypothetical protein
MEGSTSDPVIHLQQLQMSLLPFQLQIRQLVQRLQPLELWLQ